MQSGLEKTSSAVSLGHSLTSESPSWLPRLVIAHTHPQPTRPTSWDLPALFVHEGTLEVMDMEVVSLGASECIPNLVVGEG